MAGQRKDREASDDSQADGRQSGAVTPNDIASLESDALLTPRMAAEREVVKSIKGAGETIRYVLGARAFDSMADAIAIKTQSSLAQWVLESANNIGAANSGSRSPQLPAAAANSGTLAMALAQRLAAQRNGQRVVQRRIVEAVQPIAAEANGVSVQPSAAQPSASDDAADSSSRESETP